MGRRSLPASLQIGIIGIHLCPSTCEHHVKVGLLGALLHHHVSKASLPWGTSPVNIKGKGFGGEEGRESRRDQLVFRRVSKTLPGCGIRSNMALEMF